MKNIPPDEFICPICQAVIPADDVNVATDKALCRQCGKVSSFAAITEPVDAGIDLNDVPHGVKFIDGDNNESIISYHRFSPILLFLIPFTAVWSGFSLTGIYGKMIASGKYNPSEMLFGLPFLFGTVVMLTIIIFLLFGKTRITMDHGQGTVFIGVATIGWKRNFQYNQESRLSWKDTGTRVNEIPQKGICITTGNQDFVFGTLIRKDAREYIAARIKQEMSGRKNSGITRA